VKKYGTARQATDDNNSTVHAHCMLDNKEHRHTLRICLLLFNCSKCYANQNTVTFILTLPVLYTSNTGSRFMPSSSLSRSFVLYPHIHVKGIRHTLTKPLIKITDNSDL